MIYILLFEKRSNIFKWSQVGFSMVYTHLLVRSGELFLKGQNRPFFERKLINNLERLLSVKVLKKLQGRLILAYFSQHHQIKRVFGLSSYSPSLRVGKELEIIKEAAVKVLKEKKGTFRVETNRSDKSFPLPSPKINTEIGRYIEEKTALTFAFKQAQHLLTLEINQDGAYLFLETIPCFGGLPVGVEGEVSLLVENEASILAGILMMKRGCKIIPLAFSAKDITLLQKFDPKLQLQLITHLNQIKTEIVVIGETFDNYKEYTLKTIIVRPLIAYDSKQIKEQLEKFTD